ncbi:MAG TPA: DUF2793 domain-containing protein [Paracoccus sp. (in: a-proteobacteria)]|uniref:DUF2793 domain-containing protein n=1 Tax=uncultured Paracoccus sp. TaxID=189685 RepID=UPI00262B4436|nr:DUF2793 domain-containing protein [uncultured Paracoccus sp.]HMQ41777.1 DUF2793 domain-containing protein [Paracoccus sp. (in: a-proteobacteria)]HMR35882.1 DUF2793 domain-containing protein [Paracoccus sp. (in: a-proteobacteria)]
MSETTAHLALPFLMAAQAQKHVTHNEALRMLDAMVQLSVPTRTLAAPPASPAEGARYIVAAGATGLWAGWDGNVACWLDGAWMRFSPQPGWLAWVEDEAQAILWTGAAWAPMVDAMGLIAQSAAVAVAKGGNGATTGMAVIEETLTGLSGAIRDSTVTIPDRAIVLGVSSSTVTAITGATSYDCGIASEASKFGGSLGIAAGSTNRGVIGPQAFYADTPIRLTARGGSFIGGAVRIAIHLLTVGLPS